MTSSTTIASLEIEALCIHATIKQATNTAEPPIYFFHATAHIWLGSI